MIKSLPPVFAGPIDRGDHSVSALTEVLRKPAG
jgi:hypothetical protein